MLKQFCHEKIYTLKPIHQRRLTVWNARFCLIYTCTVVAYLRTFCNFLYGRASNSQAIDTARIVCPWNCRAFASLSLCLSVRPVIRLPHAAACDGFAAVGPAAKRYRSTAARPALSSKCEQCHAVSGRRKLVTSMFLLGRQIKKRLDCSYIFAMKLDDFWQMNISINFFPV